jgi:poly(3-hydroxybutyrate) depolymerase
LTHKQFNSAHKVKVNPVILGRMRYAAVLLAAGAVLWWWRTSPTPVVPSSTLLALASADARVIKTRESIRVGGETRDYVLTRPATLEPGMIYPLVVGFHGYRGEVKAWFHEYAAFDRLVAERKFIIACPDGPISWAASEKGQDLPFFDALVAELRGKHPVDPARIHVVGHSNGANFATFLLAVRADVIASGAVQAGAHLPPAKTPPGPRPPLLLMWGEQDDAAAAVAAVTKEYRPAGFTVETVIFPNWGHAWGGPANRAEERALDFFQAHRLPAAGAPAR